MARLRFLRPNRPHTPRHCDVCGESYHRRNLYEAWSTQNPGHRVGWSKVILRVCTRCQDQAKTTRSLIVVEASLTRPGKREASA